ncbi:BTB/POZ domain-containing protein 6-like [Paramacrobiotus metropolitanus]|uniref:BTB/POZ domain-containing protein 6-like n=1 Tax=Paramacrobiotus metropolitanus TaxID=2943436 RepID=UPI002445B4A9|nr:BTB/POZ domain-containing protein 6-like [Paramacrobiotus metropolitanus]
MAGSLPENTAGAIDIPDVTPDAFTNMLSFMYTDTLDGLHMDNVCQTWSCADKDDLPLLMEICCDFVKARLNVDNCLTVLENGMDCHADEIVQHCLEFVDRSADVVVQSTAFAVVGQATMVGEGGMRCP